MPACATGINGYNPQNSKTAMLRTLLISLLCFHASQVHAGWDFVTKSPRGDNYYLDSNSVQKGPISRVWSLVDLVSPIEKTASVKRLYEVDCVKGKLRVLQKLVYAQPGGQGSVLSSDKTAGPWMYSDPASVNEELMLKICFDKKEAGAEPRHEKKSSPSH